MSIQIQNPLISIYMPTCNRVNLLPRAVKSVLTQDYSNLELIIVDDASKDSTRDYLETLKESDSRVRTIYVPESKGPSHARNAAINEAKGEFITGLDDDDEFLPSRLSEFLSAWDKEYAFITSSLFWDYGKSRKLLGGKKIDISLADLLSHKHATNQVFTRKKYLIQAGLFDETMRNSEDWDLWIRLALLQLPMRKLETATYVIHTAHDLPRLSRSEQKIGGLNSLVAKYQSHMTQKNRNDISIRLAIEEQKYLSIRELFRLINKDNFSPYAKFWLRTKLPIIVQFLQKMMKRAK